MGQHDEQRADCVFHASVLTPDSRCTDTSLVNIHHKKKFFANLLFIISFTLVGFGLITVSLPLLLVVNQLYRKLSQKF